MSRRIISLKRSQAADVLEQIASWACRTDIPPDRIVSFIRVRLEREGIRFDPCPADHSRPEQINNCATCAPHWGVVGPEVKVT